MNRRLALAIMLLSLATFGLDMQLRVIHAQAITPATPQEFTVTGLAANCQLNPASTPPHIDYCFTADKGILSAVNGAAFTPIGGTASASLTVNGVTKTLPATFNITAATSQPLSTAVVTTTAPATSVTVQ